MNNKKKLAEIRQRLMSCRRVLCTGNPDNPLFLASGFRKIFDNITFIHRSAGWDLTDQSESAKHRLRLLFAQHNTFINASHIGFGIQCNLLELCNQSVKHCDVFNIGSTHEYDGGGSAAYQQSKLALRNKSLDLNTYRFQTHHIILGKIDKTLHSEDIAKKALEIDTICGVVVWIMQQPFKVPVICIDQVKMPW